MSSVLFRWVWRRESGVWPGSGGTARLRPNGRRCGQTTETDSTRPDVGGGRAEAAPEEVRAQTSARINKMHCEWSLFSQRYQLFDDHRFWIWSHSRSCAQMKLWLCVYVSLLQLQSLAVSSESRGPVRHRCTESAISNRYVVMSVWDTAFLLIVIVVMQYMKWRGETKKQRCVLCRAAVFGFVFPSVNTALARKWAVIQFHSLCRINKKG